MAYYNSFLAQYDCMMTRIDAGLDYVGEINACIDFECYANGNEEKELAIDMMKEQLRKFDPCKMEVSSENLAYIRKLQDEYGIAY